MIPVQFLGASYPTEDIAVCSRRAVNIYLEADENYKNKAVGLGFPGYNTVQTLDNGDVRGSILFNGDLIEVRGAKVYKITDGLGVTDIGTLATTQGRVGIAESGTQVCIVDGKDMWIYDGSNFSIVTASVVTTAKPDSVAAQDGWFICNEPGTGRIWVSDLYDGFTWSALRTATAEFRSDNVIRVFADKDLLLFGGTTTQGYYNSGASPMPFKAVRTARMTYGLAAKDAVVSADNTVYFLGQNKGGVSLMRLEGSRPVRASTRAWERQWSNWKYDDAFLLSMDFDGHEWVVLTFPSAQPGGRSFLYDISTQLITEIGRFEPTVGDFVAHPMMQYQRFSGRHIVSMVNGVLAELDKDIYTMGGDSLISVIRTPVIHEARERIFIHSLQLDMEVGRGLPSGQGSDPMIRIRMSEDGGLSFDNFRDEPTGKMGESIHRVKSDLWGSAYDPVFEFWFSEPLPRKFLQLYVE